MRQAAWTQEIRLHLYRRVCLARGGRILDLGCGTGVLALEAARRSGRMVVGLDQDLSALCYAKNRAGTMVHWVSAGASKLPFADETFDLILTHYFWMWCRDPWATAVECGRILQPGGRLLSLAEPDYAQRQDRPVSLSLVYRRLAEHLCRQGADPGVGPRVISFLEKAGLAVEWGQVDKGWGPEKHGREYDDEWRYLEKSLGRGPLLERIKTLERRAILSGQRRSHLPLYWAIGKKPREG